MTAADIEVIEQQAIQDELEENFEAAKKLWWQVIDVSHSVTQRQAARTAIERIDRKIARLNGNLPTPKQHQPIPVSPPPQPLPPSLPDDDLSSERF